jgi:nucleoside phosphorylase
VFTGRNGPETIGPPKVREGTIACGNVSASPDYNEAVRATDRKVLAIETESGGLFFAARQHNVPAFTVRGISDYAGIDKNVSSERLETMPESSLYLQLHHSWCDNCDLTE